MISGLDLEDVHGRAFMQQIGAVAAVFLGDTDSQQKIDDDWCQPLSPDRPRTYTCLCLMNSERKWVKQPVTTECSHWEARSSLRCFGCRAFG